MSYLFESGAQILDIQNHMSSQANQIYYNSISIYYNILDGSKMLTIEIPSLQSQTTQSIITQFSIQSMLKSLQNSMWSFISLHYLFIQAPLQPNQQSLPLLLPIFTYPFHVPTCPLYHSYKLHQHSLYT